MTGALTCAKYWRAVELFESSGHRVLESSSLLPLGESASPFIVERDGLISQRERRECIRVLSSVVAHAVGYEMIVGAYNTVLCPDASGRLYRVRLVWQTTALTTLFML